MSESSLTGRGKSSTSGEDTRQATTAEMAIAAEPGLKSTGLKSGDGGSTPSSLKPRLIWKQPGGLPECPYYYRWVLDFGLFSLRLHKWLADDDRRAHHDHPFWFITLVLWGGYTDVSSRDNYLPNTVDRLGWLSMRYRPATHRHTVKLTKRPTWTLLLTGRPLRRWSFYKDGKAIKRDKYFAEHGHHPCDPSDNPVRLRPDGSRIGV